ncbi:WYL domain-containing protein [Pseudogracilibacillus sp. SE30717A]|uniref:helix-turn-helix transcriptional regulator n=1 Tax=Pseudogracilibacillus sp. SE30717A TaxID=3098293 RepID=UPI00300E2DE1
MKQSNNFRLLQLRDLLFNETDEEHEYDIYEIEEKLVQLLDLKSIDHRTIKNDIEALQEMDFDIVRNRKKFGKIFYSHQDKYFETYQIRLLVDAILSARFITPKEKDILIEKLKELTSIHIRKTLPEPVLFSQTINHDYERIKYNIDRLHHAITGRKVVSYQYGDFNVRKEFDYRRDGELYFVEPYALIWQNDLYYLIGKFQETKEIRHYRLDRIKEITILDETFVKEKGFELQPYVDNTFHMYSGEELRMKIRFDNSLINAIFDRFGMEVDVREDGDEHFILNTNAKLSDGLVSWILKWGSRAKVISPDLLVDKISEETKKMAANYK